MENNSQTGLIAAIVFSALAVSGSLGFFAYQMNVTTPAVAESASEAGVDSDQLASILDGIDPSTAQQLLEEMARRVTAPEDILFDDDATMGNEDATVTLVEFSDYQCPYCKRHYTQTHPQIVSKYIDTGKVRYVFRDFPLSFHTDAKKAANAAECARDQEGDEAYFEMNEKLFGGDATSFSITKLVGYARDMDLNVGTFQSCVEAGTYDDEIDADMAAGASFGVRGTPGFVITNGSKSLRLEGAQPFSSFEKDIEALLGS